MSKLKIKLPSPKESDICKAFCKQVKQMQSLRAFKRDFILIHVPNESFTTKGYRYHLASLGVYKGVADYLILYNGGWVAIEFKRSKRESQSIHQKAFEIRCNEMNIPYLLTFSIEEAIDFLLKLFN